MKGFPYTSIIIAFLLFSCGNDTFNSTVIEGSDAPPTDGNNPPTEEITLTLFNVFPNLSFLQPLDMQSARDGSNRIYIVQKDGNIRVFENDSETEETSVFLNLPRISTVSEQGLLGLAFHPNFRDNGYFYVHYNPTPTISRISRFTASPNGGLTNNATELIVLEFTQPFTNHNGGQLAFGPDGFLYISSGDGGSGGDPQNNAQNKSNLLGTILRIDVDNRQGNLNYAIPGDNPFVNEPEAREEIFAYGLRNPWRMSFDTVTGMLWTGDVGQNEVEEIDIITNGGNYGWKLFEGTSCFSGSCSALDLIAPTFEYTQENGDRSITGGYVYRGLENPSLVGKYIYGDYVSGRIWALDSDGNNELLLESGFRIASFGTDAANELYICAFNGVVYKLLETVETRN